MKDVGKFITMILNFDRDHVSKATLLKLKNKLISNPDMA